MINDPGHRRADALEAIATILKRVAIGSLLLFAAWLLADVWLLVFAASLVAVALRGVADQLGALLRVSKGWSLAMVVAGLVSLVTALLWWRGPVALDEIVTLQDQLKQRIATLRQAVQATPWARAAFGHFGSTLSGSADGIVSTMAGAVTSTLGALGSLIVIVFTALYLAASPRLYMDGALRLLPPSMRGRARDVLQAIADTLRRWFAGQFVDMVLVAGLTWAGLAMLDVPLAPTLAAIAGLCNFVPFVGALAGAAPAVLIALGQGKGEALWVAGLFLVIQMLEGNVIAPIVQRRAVQLPPALTIVSQALLGALFGIMGVILATPLMAATIVVVRMVYIEGVIEPKAREQPD